MCKYAVLCTPVRGILVVLLLIAVIVTVAGVFVDIVDIVEVVGVVIVVVAVLLLVLALTVTIKLRIGYSKSWTCEANSSFLFEQKRKFLKML